MMLSTCIEGLENGIVDMTVRTTMQRGDVGGGRARGCGVVRMT
jgi:hypothetical protein